MKASLVAVALLAVACGAGSSATQAPPAPAGAVSALIGTAGGTLRAADGTSLDIPAGALLGDTIITMTPAADPPDAPGMGEPAGTTWLFGPEGQQFEHPITMTLAIEPKMLDSYETADDVLVYTSPAAHPDYVAIPTAAADDAHVTVTTTHFSHYAPRHHTKMFGLGTDTPAAVANTALFGELKDRWKSRQGHTLQSARLVYDIDLVDRNPDNQSLKLLAEANGESTSSWAKDAAGSLSRLASWVDATAAGGLIPIVAIHVTRFETCEENSTTANKSCPKHAKVKHTSLGHENFRGRFKYLLENFPKVVAWGLVNEPDVSGFADDAGIQTAVDYYIDAAKELDLRKKEKKSSYVSLFAGEFAYVWSVDASKSYWKKYGDDMIKATRAEHVAFPTRWGMHPYKDTTGTQTRHGVKFDTAGTDAYDAVLGEIEKSAHLAKDTLRVWLTETGAMLEWGLNACADSRDNDAQYKGGRQIYALAAKSRVDRVYWWQFQQAVCAWGGAWDSGMVDWNGQPRPAFYALVDRSDAYPGVSVSRDCGGPGKDHCEASGCCALCSKDAETYATYTPPATLGGTCAASAATFCAARGKGSVQYASAGSCNPVPASPHGPPPATIPSCGALGPGETLVGGNDLGSCNGQFGIVMSLSDGKVFETDSSSGPVWQLPSSGSADDHLIMQGDGNLVLYAVNGSPLWASNTSGNPGAYFDVGDDGSLLIVGGAGPLCSIKGASGSIPACP